MTVNPKNLWQRLADAQSKVDYVQKERKSGMRYSIVSHDAVTAKVRPVLVECGIHYHPVALSFSQSGNRTEVALTVRFVNVDKPDEFIDVPSLGYGIDDQDKGPGKAISYAVKYALLKTLGLETGDDPDIDQDVKHDPSPRAKLQTVTGDPAAPKAASREPYERVIRGIRDIVNTGTNEDLTAWYKTHVKTIEAFPADWHQSMMEEFSSARDTLTNKLA
jgi:ERF superfamily